MSREPEEKVKPEGAGAPRIVGEVGAGRLHLKGLTLPGLIVDQYFAHDRQLRSDLYGSDGRLIVVCFNELKAPQLDPDEKPGESTESFEVSCELCLRFRPALRATVEMDGFRRLAAALGFESSKHPINFLGEGGSDLDRCLLGHARSLYRLGHHEEASAGLWLVRSEPEASSAAKSQARKAVTRALLEFKPAGDRLVLVIFDDGSNALRFQSSIHSMAGKGAVSVSRYFTDIFQLGFLEKIRLQPELTTAQANRQWRSAFEWSTPHTRRISAYLLRRAVLGVYSSQTHEIGKRDGSIQVIPANASLQKYRCPLDASRQFQDPPAEKNLYKPCCGGLDPEDCEMIDMSGLMTRF